MGSRIIGVRFQEMGKLYHYDASSIPDLVPGDYVVIHTNRGQQIGKVVDFVPNPPKPPKDAWRKVKRKATINDLVTKQLHDSKAEEVLNTCREKASQLGIEDVDIINAEFSIKGDHLTFQYCSKGEEDVELSKLKADLKKQFKGVDIDFRRIGPRDFARLEGGFGACGMSLRCCSRFIHEFNPISIRMAKTQRISLDPSEITGMCGRLRCCLLYEFEQYVEAMERLPKKGKRVTTPMGEGKVIDLLPLTQLVIVKLNDETEMEFNLEEITSVEDSTTKKRKA